MTNDTTCAGATSRETDAAAVVKQQSVLMSSIVRSTTTQTYRSNCRETPLEPEGTNMSEESSDYSTTELVHLVTENKPSSGLRKRDSSSNLKSMGDEGGVSLATVIRNTEKELCYSGSQLQLLLADAKKEVSDDTYDSDTNTSTTSTTASESESGESDGKKSRPGSQPQPPYGRGVSDLTHTKSLPLSIDMIPKPNVAVYRSTSHPLLLLPSPDGGNDMDPDEFLLELIAALHPNVKLQVKSALALNSYFPTIREEQMLCYNTEIVQLARTNNLVALKQYYTEHGRESLNCFNRFGEGLLNLACRRGFTEMVQFLLSPDLHLDVQVRDDGGRTPLHDACWHPEPQLEICTMLLQQDPSLFLVADKRGYTPFQYARKNDWPIWRKFLVQHLDQLRILGSHPDIIATFSK